MNTAAKIGIIFNLASTKDDNFQFMTKIIKNIEQIIAQEGITVGQFERSIGASKAVISRAIANGTDIQSKWISAIIENYPQYSPAWLVTGEGEMLTSSTNSILQTNNSASFSELLHMINERDHRIEELSMQLGAAQERIRQLEEEKSSNVQDA